MLLLKKNFYIILFLLFVIFSRVISIVYFGDKIIVNEWGDILFNLENEGIFGFRRLENFIAPNLFMPPLYPILLFFLKKINLFSYHYVEFVLYVQLIISILTIYYFMQLLKIFFSGKIYFFGLIVFAFFPLNVYSVSQISSITINIFFVVCFLLNYFLYFKHNQTKYLIFFSIFCGLLILTRGEFIIFYLFALFYYFFKKKNLKNIFISFIIVFFVLSPYLVRNYIVFEKITITKSIGYNLWKGNNEYSKSEGYETIHNNEFKNKIEHLIKNNNYDIEIDRLYKNEAIKNISNYPKKYFLSYLKKLISFFFLDFESSFPHYYNLFHLAPKALLGLFSFFGAIISFKKNDYYKFLSLFYLSYGLIFSFFFILPRYSLIVLPVQIILTCNLLNNLRFNRVN